MRIIAGVLGGRIFISPHSHRTHPMSDKVRGALFNALGDIEGLTILDPFAGSGAISFEAASRGAAASLAIDNDKPAQQAIEESIVSLDLAGRVRLIKANCSSWSDNNPAQQFDIVIADPPYDKLQLSLLNKLAKHVKPGGMYVLSWPGGVEIPELEGSRLAAQKSYGDAQLLFFRQA